MNEKVLLVDNDPGLLSLISNELKNGTLDVSTERTGNGALRRLREEACSVLVLGVHLPDVSSREMMQRLKHDYPNLPVVMLAPPGALDEVRECVRQGAVDFVTKPVDALRLQTAVGNALNQRRLVRRIHTLTSGSNDQGSAMRPTGTNPFRPANEVPPSKPDEILTFEEEERRIILNALRATRWNVQEAAKRLKIGRATVYRKISQFGLRRERDNSDAA